MILGRLWGMEFLCYHRDRPGSLALREELLEEHWSYMDRYATQMTARGPTLADDGDTPTGSVQDPDTARAILTPDRYADIEVHNWQFGGRPS